jgi:hypothetical protein
MVKPNSDGREFVDLSLLDFVIHGQDSNTKLFTIEYRHLGENGKG